MLWLGIGVAAGALFILGFFTHNWWISGETKELLNPFVASGERVSYPLLAYSIPNLQQRKYTPSKIQLLEVIAEEPTYTSFLFSYTTLEKTMTGQINIPDSVTANPNQKNSAIVMLRGYVPLEIYETGVGTKNAAAVFAQNGYITIAPDFFGYGGSDPEPDDSWQTRFEKPITVIELIKTIEETGIPLVLADEETALQTTRTSNIGIWAHSNGGQIALTVLEILQQPIPTTLWAPVTAPFPYSVLYFSDELEDEGKSQRKWISLFEEDYDVFEFSLTQHLDSLTGPIQIQHGEADDAALVYWSEEFVDKIELENERRENESTPGATLAATAAAKLDQINLEPIDITLYTYPGTNHNMVPSWDKVVNRDLQFFNKWLE